jgi:hypothetical protein
MARFKKTSSSIATDAPSMLSRPTMPISIISPLLKATTTEMMPEFGI